MKNIIFSMFLVSSGFLNCTKETELISEFHYKIIVTLSNDLNILKIEQYFNDTLWYKKSCAYFKDKVEVIENRILENYLTKSTYFINAEGLADMTLDSTFHQSDLEWVTSGQIKFDNNGYKISAAYNNKHFINDTLEYSFYHTSTYGVDAGNTKTFNFEACSDYFGFTKIENKLDIVSFLGDFKGKKDTNLRESYRTGCHSGPSTDPPYSIFDYKLNSNNFVIESIELYTTGHHQTDSEPPSKEKRITTYEYRFE